MSFSSRPGRPFSTDRLARALRGLAGAAIVCTSAAFACGPDFPNRYLDLSDDEILAAPEGTFADEVARLAGGLAPRFRTVPVRANETPDAPWRAEAAELEQAVLAAGGSKAEARAAADSYFRARQGRAPDSATGATAWPAEFRLYFLGAVAWHRGETEQAARPWRELLALPEGARRHRGAWAAFMLGRIAEQATEAAGATEAGRAQAAEAAKYFQLTRALVAAGANDPRGLAAESLGWEARAAWKSGDAATALNLYLAQLATGDDGAVVSLRWVTADVFRQGIDARLVADPAARGVLTAFLVSRIGSSPWSDDQLPFVEWAETLATACEHADVAGAPEADRLAWLAYEGGLFELAERWVRLAPEGSAPANWIRAKLALRRGELPAGEKHLRAALAEPQLADDHRSRLYAELGRVALARNDYAGALRAWLAGGHWPDAAFVAENVLSADELKGFVDAAPAPTPAVTTDSGWAPAQPAALRQLLARRLARARQFDAAEPYFAAAERAQLRAYVNDIRLGFDPARPAAERAAAFWRAAQLVRANGMELFGTELEPDWNIWGGSFDWGSTRDDRRAGAKTSRRIFAPTADELARLEQAKGPQRRFHYRYRAAEIAGWAAGLLPNDSPETAHLLYTAGGWLKARDPEAANPFYQALVIRCGNTPLGRAAAAKHWFPDDESDAAAFGAEPGPTAPTGPAAAPKNPRRGRR